MQIGTGLVHPGMRGYGVTWWRGRGLVGGEEFRHGDVASPQWHDSPIAYMIQNDVQTFTARLDGAAPPERWFPIYDDLRAEGITEYHAEMFPFGWDSSADHETHVRELGLVSSWSTRSPGGFGDALPLLRGLLPPFALALKARAFTDMAEALMDTYVGRDAGRRILHGDIHRGDTTVMRAAILLADLRGFTSLSDRVPSADMVQLLNRYMETICAAVHARHGEVLKFLGDGLLAVFPDAREGFADDAMQAALSARADVQRLNRELEAAGDDWMPLDIALHLGEVSYGNIGAPDRLDFTVIGPAVNEASRMEGACAATGRDLLISAALADALRDSSGIEAVGDIALKGLDRPRRLYGITADV
jgi:adenylate cyclase